MFLRSRPKVPKVQARLTKMRISYCRRVPLKSVFHRHQSTRRLLPNRKILSHRKRSKLPKVRLTKSQNNYCRLKIVLKKLQSNKRPQKILAKKLRKILLLLRKCQRKLQSKKLWSIDVLREFISYVAFKIFQFVNFLLLSSSLSFKIYMNYIYFFVLSSIHF